MDAIEKLYCSSLLEALGSPKFNAFKKGLKSNENSKIYEASLKAIREVNQTENINSDSLTLIKSNINKVRLTKGKRKTFIYCGCYMLRGERIVLLELKETIGTYYLIDSNIVRQLGNHKVGTIIGLVKESEKSDGIKLLTSSDCNVGLFE